MDGGLLVIPGATRVISCAWGRGLPGSSQTFEALGTAPVAEHGAATHDLRMTSDGLRSSRVVALALAVGTFFVAQEILSDLAGGRPADIAPRARVVLLFWVVWAFLTPAVLKAVRRWPIDARPVYRPLLVHAAVATTLAASQRIITIGLGSVLLYLRGGVSAQGALRRNDSPVAFVWGVFTGVFFYAVVVMVYTAVRYRTMYDAERLSAAELASRSAALETELTRSKLDTLRSQLRPHFLFNTLNAISVFVTEDADKAQQMLLRLSTLLRRSLDEEAHEVPLQQELGFVNDYLDIQRGRFGDQLTVRLAVDPAVLNARVPVFLLQPLLENAIEHGKSDDNRTTIALSAGRDRDTLHITLTDDGPGVRDSAPVREGIGLRNTRARLHHLYGPGATVELGPAHGKTESPGARLEIRIPFRETPA
jgi:two-component system, LytTR family, sensor kinase